MATINISLASFFENCERAADGTLESSFELDGKQQKIRLFVKGAPAPSIDLDLPALLRANTAGQGYVELKAQLEGGEHTVRVFVGDVAASEAERRGTTINGQCNETQNKGCN